MRRLDFVGSLLTNILKDLSVSLYKSFECHAAELVITELVANARNLQYRLDSAQSNLELFIFATLPLDHRLIDFRLHRHQLLVLVVLVEHLLDSPFHRVKNEPLLGFCTLARTSKDLLFLAELFLECNDADAVLHLVLFYEVNAFPDALDCIRLDSQLQLEI